MRILTVTVVVLISLVAIVAGETAPDCEHIYVGAYAVVKAVPDIATIKVTILHTDMEQAKAKAVVDERSNKVIGLARELGIKKEDVTATALNFQPHHEWTDNKPVDGGTEVGREIELTLRDLSKYSELIQRLSEVPITSLRQAEMSSSRVEELYDEALAKAIEKAKMRAKSIAAQFGAGVGDVYSISETPLRREESGGFLYDSSGITKGQVFEPGTIDIEARIYVIFRLRLGE